ncbi:alpha/beta-hydrolase [Meredithblackwellia eburnea MCA 4105]
MTRSWLFLLLPALVISKQLSFQSLNPPPQSFTLRSAIHLSPSHDHPPLHRVFAPHEQVQFYASTASDDDESSAVRTIRSKAWRPNNPRAYQAARRASFHRKRAARTGEILTAQQEQDILLAQGLDWDEEDIEVPDTSDWRTLDLFAKLANNGYTLPPGDWYDLEGKYNYSSDFGWEADGMRGVVFADPTNSTVVVSIKGTSVPLVGGSESSTSKHDKANDNLLFSCCCSRVGWSWTTVCDCYDGNYTCKQDCLEAAVMEKESYYTNALDLYNNISYMYPNSQIWLTGHSLGGALSALLSLTFGVPSISFESPADALAARRLHLPIPPLPPPTDPKSKTIHSNLYSYSNITTHVYHNADPIPMGTCNGVTSWCALAGFAFESTCHVGKSRVYDTVGRLGWSVDVRTHSIQRLIGTLFVEDWGGGDKDDGQNGGKGVPDESEDQDCEECFRWTFEE